MHIRYASLVLMHALLAEPVKKPAKKYDAFLTSEALIKQIPRLLGPGLSKGASLFSYFFLTSLY